MAGKASSRRANLLVEIGVEELPPKTLKTLAQAFAAKLAEELIAAGVVDDALHDKHHYRYFATPRRMAALVYDVAAQAPARVVERRGPSLQAAFDDNGKPSRAAEGFAKSCGSGVEVAQLDTLKTDKGAWLVYRQRITGAKLANIVTDCLEQSVRRLPIAKRMRWGKSAVEFVRPAHWLLVLHGERIVKTQVLGLKANRLTRGHRFHARKPLPVANADAYADLLESDGKVIADFELRRSVINKQLARLAKQCGARPPVDDELLDLVTGLVEWPRALRGEFDRRFLKIPAQALVSCMRDHQKFFPLADDKGRLLPGFLAVSNIAASARIRKGNERVLRARLADAEFFCNSDLKTPLHARADMLKDVLFHHKLGSLHDKTARVVELAGVVAAQLDGGIDANQVARAAALCKADLVTDMVGEFPELQGTMGRYYAKKSGEDNVVADAIEQHYLPRYSGDKLPAGAIAQSVAVADRLDSLTGLFAGGEIPSGDKDPFALRRAALGVLRILIEKKLDLDVYELLNASWRIYQNSTAAVTVSPGNETVEQVFEFILDRLAAYYQPMGYNAAELASVMACKPHKPIDFDCRLKALSRFFKRQPEAADSLAAANKRIAGILQRATSDTGNAPPQYDASLLREKAEITLARQLDKIGAQADACFSGNRYDYDRGFVALSKLKQPIDVFFDEVLVMDEDAALRNNRLALLGRIRELFLGAADISLMRAER